MKVNKADIDFNILKEKMLKQVHKNCYLCQGCSTVNNCKSPCDQLDRYTDVKINHIKNDNNLLK